MPTIEEMKKAATSWEQFWGVRNRRFEQSYSLRAMEDKYQKQNFLSIALNDARSFFDLALFLISGKPPVIRVPILGKSDPEQERSDLSELGLQGVQRLIDRERMAMGQESWLRAMADFMLATGWYAHMRMVVKNDDGTPQFISEVWDPAQVFPEFGQGQLVGVAHIYPDTLASVRAKAEALDWEGDFSGDGTIEVWVKDIWQVETTRKGSKVYNAIVVTGTGIGKDGIEVAKPPDELEALKEIPIRTGPVGGWAVRSSRPKDLDSQARMGEGILEAGKPVYDAKNIWATLVMQKVHDAAQPLTQLKSRQGRWTLSEGDLTAGHAIATKLDEDILYPQKPPLPSEIGNLIMPMLNTAIQRASISDLFYGNVQGMDLAGAGFAISLLEPNALSKLGPYATALEFVGSERDSYFLEEFRSGGYKPVRIAGSSDQTSAVRRVFYREWSPDDVPESTLVDWEIRLSTPSDLIQSLAIARQAYPDGDLLDLDTLLERVLKVDQVARVKRGIDKARLQRTPLYAAIRQVETAQGYARELRQAGRIELLRGNLEGAKAKETLAAMVEAGIQATIAGLQGSNRGQTDREGIPPEVLSPQITRQLGGTLGPGKGNGRT